MNIDFEAARIYVRSNECPSEYEEESLLRRLWTRVQQEKNEDMHTYEHLIRIGRLMAACSKNLPQVFCVMNPLSIKRASKTFYRYFKYDRRQLMAPFTRFFTSGRLKEYVLTRNIEVGTAYETWVADVEDDDDAVDALIGTIMTDFDPSILSRPWPAMEEMRRVRVDGKKTVMKRQVQNVLAMAKGERYYESVNYRELVCTERVLRCLARCWSLEVKEGGDCLYRLVSLCQTPEASVGEDVKDDEPIRYIRPEALSPYYERNRGRPRRIPVISDQKGTQLRQVLSLDLKSLKKTRIKVDPFWDCQQILQYALVHGEKNENWFCWSWHEVQTSKKKAAALREESAMRAICGDCGIKRFILASGLDELRALHSSERLGNGHPVITKLGLPDLFLKHGRTDSAMPVLKKIVCEFMRANGFMHYLPETVGCPFVLLAQAWRQQPHRMTTTAVCSILLACAPLMMDYQSMRALVESVVPFEILEKALDTDSIVTDMVTRFEYIAPPCLPENDTTHDNLLMRVTDYVNRFYFKEKLPPTLLRWTLRTCLLLQQREE